MGSASAGFTQKITARAFITLVILSFLGLLYFVSISTFSLLTGSFSHYSHGCFLFSAVLNCPWRLDNSVFSTLRLGGGVMILRNIFCSCGLLSSHVLISIVARFVGQQRSLQSSFWVWVLWHST
jgi:hypothetical protein